MSFGTTEEPSEPPAQPEHDPYAALRLRNFRFYLAGNALAIFGMQAQTLAVGWELYERTHSAFALGLEGLVQFLPVAALTLPAGHEADRSHRKAIVMIAMFTMVCCSLALAWVSITKADVGLIYICLLASGVARAFLQPAKASLLPQIVPRETFSNAVTWNMNGFQMAAIAGPAVGGQLIAYFKSAWVVYLVDAGMTSIFLLFLAVMHVPRHVGSSGASSLNTLLAGLSFVWRNKVILGAMTLDMFAVLLGGAVTLVPVFAEDILQVGPTG
ncbi:MAG: MFS transporter, partial [Candidatus Saccharimonadales bacterium]